MTADFLKKDLDVIFSPNVFGETDGVVWNGVTVKDAIFDDESIETQMGEGVAEIIEQPMITGKTDDFVGIDTDDPIQVNGETFVVQNWKVDGTGVIEIFLTRNPE
jgi:hypothetical protein